MKAFRVPYDPFHSGYRLLKYCGTYVPMANPPRNRSGPAMNTHKTALSRAMCLNVLVRLFLVESASTVVNKGVTSCSLCEVFGSLTKKNTNRDESMPTPPMIYDATLHPTDNESVILNELKAPPR
mmetsp:Transcript_8178/g.15123  ORF Transcript_8178/g.15123 Transcript_8178/m.15123 type:complete len:125 (+) Transcript_8178:3619-3993(+)